MGTLMKPAISVHRGLATITEGGRYSTERTTNVAEGWNKEFNKITGKNPTVGFSLGGVYESKRRSVTEVPLATPMSLSYSFLQISFKIL